MPRTDTPRAATQRKPWAVRHTQLLNAAELLFAERGLAAVSLEDIAHAGGVSKPIAYRHFKSRDQAYLACAHRAQADYLDVLRTITDPTAPVRDQLAASANAFFALLEEQPARWELVYAPPSVLPASSRDELAALRFETIAFVHELILAASPNAPEPLAEAFAHAISGVGERLAHWWKTRPDVSRGQLVGMFVTVVYQGAEPFVP
ncbi:MAG TPA: TetR/AcrR family transcriptional regulator [Solirubrobacteraceae bacterium]|jgi:AcrR family transcriptional regulator|nr:TetR/AcrR family transcriptional regulator [Solirubrobacteraceae bacterium]